MILFFEIGIKRNGREKPGDLPSYQDDNNKILDYTSYIYIYLHTILLYRNKKPKRVHFPSPVPFWASRCENAYHCSKSALRVGLSASPPMMLLNDLAEFLD